MEPTYADVISKNVLFALHKAGVSKGAMAAELGVSGKTFAKRLQDAQFTFGQLVVIARATDSRWSDLLPAETAAA